MKKMIQELHELAIKEFNKQEAKDFLPTLIFNVVSDCVDAGDPNVAEAIEREITETHRIFVLKKKAA